MGNDMSYDDTAAAEFYEDERNREPGEAPSRRRRRGQTRQLDSHVPVRFPSDTIESVKAIAAVDGLTVSSWIRHLVTLELARRLAPKTDSELKEQARNIGDTLHTDALAHVEKIPA